MSKATIIPYFNAKVDTIQVAGGQRRVHLAFSNTKMLQQYLLQFIGKKVQVAIRPVNKIRSDNQNRYYWGVVIAMIAEYSGMTTDETHEALKWKFLKTARRLTDTAGSKIFDVDTVRSTASLRTGEFESYLAEVRQFAAADLGIVIPLPNEVDLENV